MPYRTRSQRLD